MHELFCLPQLLHGVHGPPGLSLNGLGKLVTEIEETFTVNYKLVFKETENARGYFDVVI